MNAWGASASENERSSGLWISPRSSIPASASTDGTVSTSAFVQRPVSVIGGNTYAFYLNGMMTGGQDPSDVFWFANMVAVFYPA